MVDTEGFSNDLSIIDTKDDALTALIHLGYLAYDAEESAVFIPNYEVAKAYQLALKKGAWADVARSIDRCDELLKATADGNTQRVAELIDLAHETYTSVLKYDQSADAAIRQLKEKRYAGALQGYEKEILLVGINYDRETKQHKCVIERINE